MLQDTSDLVQAAISGNSTRLGSGTEEGSVSTQGEALPICPCCNQPYAPKAPYTLDPYSQSLAVSGKVLRLTPDQFLLLLAFHQAAPAFVSNQRAIFALYGAWDREEPSNADRVVKVHVCRIRKMLKGTDLAIVNKFGFGYRLAVRPGATA